MFKHSKQNSKKAFYTHIMKCVRLSSILLHSFNLSFRSFTTASPLWFTNVMSLLESNNLQSLILSFVINFALPPYAPMRLLVIIIIVILSLNQNETFKGEL